ncbi:hypothetical protein AB5N19_10800 [Seiridium cardinale]
MDSNMTGSFLSPRPLQVAKIGKSMSMQDLESSPPSIFGRLDDMDRSHTRNDASDVTPRPINHPISGKSSSYKLLKTQTPRLLTKLRSFSNGRASSSRATCRRYDMGSRESSAGSPTASGQLGRRPSSQERASTFDGSSSEGSYDPDPVMPLGHDGFNTYEFRQISSSVPSVHGSSDPAWEPSLLIPHIRIVPEMTTLGDGTATVNAPRCIIPGSSHLTLAHLKLGPLQPLQKTATYTNETDNLIADLEYQLGDTKTNFMEVTLSYSHSGFPQTRLETTVVGTVKRHNPASVWSPSQPLISNDLSPLIEAHWGPRKAYHIMEHISKLRRASDSRKSAMKRWNLNLGGWW